MPHRHDSPTPQLRQLELVLHRSPDFIGVSDTRGVPVFVNEAALKLVGATWEEVLLTPVVEFFTPEERAFVLNEVLPTVLKNGYWAGNLTFRHFRTEERIPVYYDVFRIDDPETGEPTHFATITRDLREARRRDRALQSAQQQISSVLAATEVGTWTYEIPSNRVIADANLSRIFGVSLEEAAEATLQTYLRAIHPEDRSIVEKAIGDAIRDGSKFLSEYRLMQKDGSVRSVIARGRVERDSDGRPLRLPGVILDITDRVAAESAQTALSARLEQQGRVMDTLLSSIADFTYIFDRQGHFHYANKALLDLWGLRLDQVIGRGFADLHYPEDLATKLLEQIEQVYRTRQSVSDKGPYTTPTGAEGYYEYIFWPVLDTNGEVELVAGSTREITERQKVFDALQQSEENFRTLAETLPDMVWMADPAGHLLWTNSVLLRRTGLSLAELREYAPAQLFHPDDAATVRQAWQAAQETGEGFECQTRVHMHDGAWRWQLLRGTPARDAAGAVYRWIGTATDIHEQRELTQKLAQSETRFRQLADSIPQLAWMARPDGWIFWYNQRWHDYTGTTPAEMEGWGWQRVHDPEFLPRVMEKWQDSLASGVPFDMTFPLRGADGVFRPFLTRVMPFRDETGAITMWFGTNTDVSEQKRMEQARDELLHSERAARTTAERTSKMKDEFLATLSHELRTPLNAIFGWIHILKEDAGDAATVEEGIKVIDRNVRAQSQLIEDLLDMSRIISGKLRLNVRQIQPATCVEAAIETVTPAAQAKSIRLEAVIDPHAGPISGDAARIQQVVWNLLSNAIKFTPRGGRVQVILERVDSHLELTVADSGEGIAPEFLPHVFDRFRQADGATTRKHSGLGLGLSIVKQLVELHGGTIRAISGGAGKGATFSIHLPLKVLHTPPGDAPHPHLSSAAPAPVAMPSANLSGIKVLVVDDERDSRELLQRVLEQCGATVAIADSAEHALPMMKDLRPDILVSDIGMPDVDGYEFLRRVRTLPAAEGGTVPAVALTAFARSEDRTKSLLAGFLSHVSKPAEPTELIATIASVVGRIGK